MSLQMQARYSDLCQFDTLYSSTSQPTTTPRQRTGGKKLQVGALANPFIPVYMFVGLVSRHVVPLRPGLTRTSFDGSTSATYCLLINSLSGRGQRALIAVTRSSGG